MIGLVRQQEGWGGKAREDIEELGTGGTLQVLEFWSDVADDGEEGWVQRFQRGVTSSQQRVDVLRHPRVSAGCTKPVHTGEQRRHTDMRKSA